MAGESSRKSPNPARTSGMAAPTTLCATAISTQIHFSAISNGDSRDPLRRNQYGATFGGPIEIPHVVNGRDRFFFFVGYQGQKQSDLATPTSSQVPVFTPAEVASATFLRPGRTAVPIHSLPASLPGSGRTPASRASRTAADAVRLIRHDDGHPRYDAPVFSGAHTAGGMCDVCLRPRSDEIQSRLAGLHQPRLGACLACRPNHSHQRLDQQHQRAHHAIRFSGHAERPDHRDARRPAKSADQSVRDRVRSRSVCRRAGIHYLQQDRRLFSEPLLHPHDFGRQAERAAIQHPETL